MPSKLNGQIDTISKMFRDPEGVHSFLVDHVNKGNPNICTENGSLKKCLVGNLKDLQDKKEEQGGSRILNIKVLGDLVHHGKSFEEIKSELLGTPAPTVEA